MVDGRGEAGRFAWVVDEYHGDGVAVLEEDLGQLHQVENDGPLRGFRW